MVRPRLARTWERTMSGQTAASELQRQPADVSFADPTFLADPWAAMIRLQEAAPVFYSKNQGGWILSRYDDVRAAFSDRRFSASRVEQLFRGMPPEIQKQL